jgi:hypothetical protein
MASGARKMADFTRDLRRRADGSNAACRIIDGAFMGRAADEIDRLNNAIAMTLDLLQERHDGASYSDAVDAAERFLEAQYKPPSLEG